MNKNTKKNLTLTLCVFTSALLSGSASRAAVTVGDPANPGALPQALTSAYNAGERQITIAPGTYTMPLVGHNVFDLNGWSNATISAYGVTLINSETGDNNRLFAFNNCNGVTFQGANLTNATPTTYQGRVVALGSEAGGKTYADWRPDVGYPVPATGASTLNCNFVDSATRQLKLRGGDFFGIAQESLGNNLFRVHFNETSQNFVVGDFLVARRGAPIKILLWKSRDCTIKDITMSRNGFAPIREDGRGGGGNHILGVKWTPGARPVGATENPLVSGDADGLHSTSADPGPDIENCIFEGVILDDPIAIHGYFVAVTASAENTLTYDNTDNGPLVGEKVRISNTNGFFAEASATAVQNNATSTTVTLDQALTIPAGSKFSVPSLDGRGFRIINNQIRGTRSRGILVKGDDGLIRGNLIENCGMSAISIGPEYYWGESNYSKNVRVENNTISGNGRQGFGGGAVLIHGDGAMGNRDIVVQNNQFISNYNVDFEAKYVSGLKLLWNNFSNTNQVSWGSTTVVDLANSDNVTLRGNLVTNQGSMGTSLVIVGNLVTNLQNNNPVGIRKGLLSNALYTFIHRGTNQALNVPNNTSVSNTKLQQYTINGTDAQRWVVTDLGTGYYKIAHRNTNQVMQSTSLAVVQNTDNSSNLQQQWSIQEQNNGSVKITNRASGRCLEVAGGSLLAGAKVQQGADNGTDAQRWVTSVVSPLASANLVKNPSFEENGFTFTPNYWTTTPQENTSYAQSGTETVDGTYYLVQYKNAPFGVTTAQNIGGLGTTSLYTLSAWVLTSGGFSQSFMFAKGYNAANTPLNVDVPPNAGQWTRITLPNIPVTNGNCQVGFYSVTGTADEFLYVDQVEFFKQ